MTEASKFSTPQQLPSEKLTKMLVAAILRNDEGGIASLVKMGANPNQSDIKGNSPVVIAATDPREHGALKSLLESGADPNYPSVNGRIPLHSVLRMKDEKVMETAINLLLAGRADPNLVEKIPGETPRSPLEAALEKSRSDKIIYLLMKGGADPCRGLNPVLHQMAEAGRYALIQAAHAAGVNLDHQDGQGLTPLMRASRAGAFRTIEVLLECGATRL